MKDVIITSLPEDQIQKRGIRDWPIWEKEVSRFDWVYDGDEECLVLEGEVDVETPEGVVSIKPGDFVTFKKGLKCIWDIKSPIKKYYNFP